MIEFLRESDNFAGITFNGCFNMPIDDLEILYNHYKETGKNFLDDYCKVKYAIWDGEPAQVDPFCERAEILNGENFNNMRVSISNMRSLGLYDLETLREVEYWAKIKHDSYKEWQSREVERERNIASNYTSNPNIRNKVFDKHGRECLACGSDENLTIDHVEPIARGGENEIYNLQPLCQSCNSSKGTKIIDYR